MAYNTYVLPVLLYVAQFSWVPAKVLALELPAVARILHTPMHVLGRDGHLLLDQVGIRPFRGMLASCCAALYRSAVASLPDTFALWLEMHEKISSSSIATAHTGHLGRVPRAEENHPRVRICVHHANFISMENATMEMHVANGIFRCANSTREEFVELEPRYGVKVS